MEKNLKSLSDTNPFLKGKDKEALRQEFARSIATSTAVTTGESIEELIEELLKPETVLTKFSVYKDGKLLKREWVKLRAR